jgi:hypothetical protein
MFNLSSSKLWRHAAVGCCIVDGWVDHGCTDVSCVWGISSDSSERNRTLRRRLITQRQHMQNHFTTLRGCEILHYQGLRVQHQNYAAPSFYTEVLLFPESHHESSWVLHWVFQVLHHQSSKVQPLTLNYKVELTKRICNTLFELTILML